MENLNRAEADKQLVDLGREITAAQLETNAAFIHHKDAESREFYKPDAVGDWEKLYAAEFPSLVTNTLQSVADYLNDNPDGLNLSATMIHVVNPEKVRVVSAPFGGWKERQTHLVANALIPSHKFNEFVAPDEFVPYLQSCFCEDGDVSTLIKICGNLVDTSELQSLDDGCSQEVSIRAGAARKVDVPVPSPAILYPFSTFAEIAQPARKFVFRLGSQPLRCKLLEADGGSWRLTAITGIAHWLHESVNDDVRVIA